MKLLILSFLLYCSFLSYGQNKRPFEVYYDLINKGNDAYDSAKYIEATSFYTQAFKKVETPFTKDLVWAAIVCIKQKRIQKAKKYYKKAARYGFIPADSILSKIDQNNPQSLLTDLQKIQKKHAQKFNNAYLRLVDSLFQVDQQIRMSIKFTLNGLNIDSLNTTCLVNAITLYGFPSEKNVGIGNARSAFFIFLHADFDIDNVLLGNLLLQAVKTGQFRPIDYAQIIDRRYNFSGKPFVYYQVPFGYDKLSKSEKEKITAKRALIGLRSVEKTIDYAFQPDGSLLTKMKE